MFRSTLHKLSLALVIGLLLSACTKDECISCIAETPSGVILEQRIGCNTSKGYTDGFEEGFRQRYREQGDTARVNCARFRTR